MPPRRRPLSVKSLNTLVLISTHGIYGYSPDAFSAPDLPLVAILDDDERAVLPVRSVRALLARDLLREIDEGDYYYRLKITDAGRDLAREVQDATRA